MADQVLIIDDDKRLSAMVAEYLTGNGLRVVTADTAGAGLAEIARLSPDAVVLDVMLPDMDGFEALKRIRAKSDVPVLMLTARGGETDRIVGLEIGADDYLSKPSNSRELLARLKAILRRRNAGANTSPRIMRFGRLEIDPASRSARVEGRDCPMTSYQFDLLVAFAESPGRTLSREQLMDIVKGEAFDRSIDVHVSRIRAAIETDPKDPRRIITVRGVGYVFARCQDDDR
ncbi:MULTISPECIES: response regulator transcription factor [Mesorhizobium]|uniref:response regulator n=1 Tax=Mesorhizobium TaxID=68287 RepID=UPI000BB0A8BE|nr:MULTISPECIES: response regulator transcription factor [Mesorhizobium]PBB28998.1 DNA-binding response regulator [Mesorhizobium sp. WSM3882]PBB31145.1 DNA-binding response regulator [Mesorhizobium sp. WSM3868]PBB40049.1 DNA-binding response regulator [Mesorhizobium sp. WSM3866]PBB58124.1 DNA-binding response regulator [Mesorhizobium loti]PBB77841.1 DNA-binding response regulator [Mesorhizobium sp. WSM3879]